MWGPEVPPALPVIDQGTSEGWGGQGGIKQDKISTTASPEVGLSQGRNIQVGLSLQANAAQWG